MVKMRIEIDLDREDVITLKHIKCILDNKVYKITGEDLTLPTELKKAMAILYAQEDKIGKTIPIADFEDDLVEDGYKRKEAAEMIDKLKKHGMIFEPREGFIQII